VQGSASAADPVSAQLLRMHPPPMKRSTRRPLTPVRILSHAFASRFASPVAYLHSSISCKRCLESRRLIVRFADFPSKAAYTSWAHRVLGIHVHERCVHKRLRRRLSNCNDPARPRSSTRAGQERPPARGTSRYQSIKQFINCIEASYQQSTGQALRPKSRPGCIAFVALEGGAVTILAFAPPRRYSG
jgi:hypothetical protein